MSTEINENVKRWTAKRKMALVLARLATQIPHPWPLQTPPSEWRALAR